jgi:hypothetical protein
MLRIDASPRGPDRVLEARRVPDGEAALDPGLRTLCGSVPGQGLRGSGTEAPRPLSDLLEGHARERRLGARLRVPERPWFARDGSGLRGRAGAGRGRLGVRRGAPEVREGVERPARGCAECGRRNVGAGAKAVPAQILGAAGAKAVPAQLFGAAGANAVPAQLFGAAGANAVPAQLFGAAGDKAGPAPVSAAAPGEPAIPSATGSDSAAAPRRARGAVAGVEPGRERGAG